MVVASAAPKGETPVFAVAHEPAKPPAIKATTVNVSQNAYRENDEFPDIGTSNIFVSYPSIIRCTLVAREMPFISRRPSVPESDWPGCEYGVSVRAAVF
jgi:hypothetical protein